MAKTAKKVGFSTKHIDINSANKTIIIAVSATVAIAVFSAVATQALIKQMSYQNKVIGLRSKAKATLAKNLKARTQLVNAYKTFDEAPESIIGTKDKNAKIVLDALPSKYDFPALATSLEALVKNSGLEINSLTGTDGEATAVQESTDPKPVDIEFSIGGNGSNTAVQNLFNNIERSIRPIKVGTVTLSADSKNNLSVSIKAKTYYQPAKLLEIKEEVVSGTNTKTTAKKSTTGSSSSSTSSSTSGAANSSQSKAGL
jgi:hypothetical protein